MGNWNITIQGIGSHGNGKPEIDADLLAVDFVNYLQSRGQIIESASFTCGGKVDLIEKSGRVKILVNGVSYKSLHTVSYEEVKKLAGFIAPVVTITFRKAKFENAGILGLGQSIKVIDGTIFDVADTSNV
jgi:hypothetical protein